MAGYEIKPSIGEPIFPYAPESIVRVGALKGVQVFKTGANRSADVGKFDYEGFLSPLVIERFGEYMNKHRILPDGSTRDSDNWQKGIPFKNYMKSGWRHFFDWWREHRGIESQEGLEDSLCALLFNVQGYLHEHLKAKTTDGS